MVHDERLEGPAAEALIAAAVTLARQVVRTSTCFEPAIAALDAACGERPLLPSHTLVLDLSVLLSGERLLPIRPPASARLRDALRGYEDHVLARLTADRRWSRLEEAVRASLPALKPLAVGLVVSQLLGRLGLKGGVGVSQAIVRRFASRTGEEVAQQGEQALSDEALADRLADGFDALARAARRTRELLSDAELFLVENLGALKGLGPRVQLAQLAEVAQAIEEELPRRLKAQSFEDGDAPTQLEEDSAYPVGGFSSLSTSGSLENLVTSELIYMDDGALRPDLFDVRFVESELLYYARDESVAVRRRRTLVLVFDGSLLKGRVLDPGERYQRLVWLSGSVAALVRKLALWLDADALNFELVFEGPPAEGPLAEEAGVLSLLLREFRERGQLTVRTSPRSVDAIRQAKESWGGRARVVLFAARIPSGLEGPAQPELFVDVGGPQPRVHRLDGHAPAEGPGEDARARWGEATRQVLDALLKRPRAPSLPRR